MPISVCSDCWWYDDGICRRRPPTVLPNISSDYPDEYNRDRSYMSTILVTCWPKVHKGDWCGFWQQGGQRGAAHPDPDPSKEK
jgi:hypothetical protein